ncbi:Pre-mRNA-splicing factor cwc25 [Penicillium subrubescens]|uniref:Pre-mRNA-splicing factor cwc25 n=1 Tax=Penicillium subrubescens TaxID=1316194 RepID=UPI00254521AF|nr:Pre-mRNA-splicing factor cwc25 [Penicillium subrubescens]KAJ5896332.1 Pre-mRNA-splicing factor cwc25 [Penicillium subrubescens]
MGGDLNLKKSWHPSLLRNQERVWQQEKRALDERKKVEQLRREREEERQIQELQRLQETSGKTAPQSRVDWMYQAPSSSTGHYSEEMEGYLLGKRRIDGILLKNDADNQKLEKGADVVGANAAAGPSVGSARDTMTKVLNDPLLEVKKREQAAYEAAVMEAARRKEREARRKGDSGRDSGRDRDRDRRHRDHDSKRRRYSDEGEDDRRRSHHRSERRHRSRSPASPERSHRRHRSERDREHDRDDRDRREDRRRGDNARSRRDDRDRDRDGERDRRDDRRDYRERRSSYTSQTRDRDSGPKRDRDQDNERERSPRRSSPRRRSPIIHQGQGRNDRGNGDRRDSPAETTIIATTHTTETVGHLLPALRLTSQTPNSKRRSAFASLQKCNQMQTSLRQNAASELLSLLPKNKSRRRQMISSVLTAVNLCPRYISVCKKTAWTSASGAVVVDCPRWRRIEDSESKVRTCASTSSP